MGWQKNNRDILFFFLTHILLSFCSTFEFKETVLYFLPKQTVSSNRQTPKTAKDHMCRLNIRVDATFKKKHISYGDVYPSMYRTFYLYIFGPISQKNPKKDQSKNLFIALKYLLNGTISYPLKIAPEILFY